MKSLKVREPSEYHSNPFPFDIISDLSLKPAEDLLHELSFLSKKKLSQEV